MNDNFLAKFLMTAMFMTGAGFGTLTLLYGLGGDERFFVMSGCPEAAAAFQE